MEVVSSLTFSEFTLLLLFMLPFSYFALHAKYWYRPDALRRFDFILGAVAIGLAVGVLLKIALHVPSNTESGRESLILPLLHLLLPILTLLILKQGVSGIGPLGTRNKSKTEGVTDFSPTPLNKEIEKLGWDDLVIDEHLKQELVSVIDLLKDPKTTKKYGIEVPKGILLSGPPGTGKTTIAKVIANVAHLSFFVLKLDEVISKWVGESEKNLSKLFKAASKYSPAVIFVDEVDSIGASRGAGDGQKWSETLLNHLLQLIDGVIKTEGLYIIAATNRPDLVDAALKRSGRLNKVIEVPLPDKSARRKLFELYLSKLTLAESLDLEVLSELTHGKSCADIRAICNQAGLNAFKRESKNKVRAYAVTNHDLAQALQEFGVS